MEKAFDKVLKCINSCNSFEQLISARKMISLYITQYNHQISGIELRKQWYIRHDEWLNKLKL